EPAMPKATPEMEAPIAKRRSPRLLAPPCNGMARSPISATFVPLMKIFANILPSTARRVAARCTHSPLGMAGDDITTSAESAAFCHLNSVAVGVIESCHMGLSLLERPPHACAIVSSDEFGIAHTIAWIVM